MTGQTRTPEEVIGQIDGLLRAGDLDAALGQAIAAQAAHPAHVMIGRKRAAVLRRLGREKDAAEVLRELLDREPNNISVALELAVALRCDGRSAAAEDLFVRMLQTHPTNEWLLSGQIEVATARGDLDVALARSAAAVALRPDSIVLTRKRAGVLRSAGRNAEAVGVLRGLQARAPDDMDLALDLAAALRTLGETVEAEGLYRRVLRDRPAHETAHSAMIDILLDRGDLSAAQEHAEAAHSANPASALVGRRRANLLRRSGREQEACGLLQQLHRQVPRDVSVALELAVALRSLGQMAAAEDLFVRMLQTHPKNEWLLSGQIEVAAARGDLDVALARSAAAVALRPDSSVLTRKRAGMLRSAGRNAEAVGVLRGLQEATPADSTILLDLGNTYLAMGDLEAGLEAFRKALQVDPTHWLALEGIARIHESQGSLDKAIGVLTHVIELPDVAADGTPTDRRSREIAKGPPNGLVIRYLDLLAKRGDKAMAALFSATLRTRQGGFTDHDLTALIRVAERLEDQAPLLSVLEEVAGRPTLDIGLAMTVLRIAHRHEPPGRAEEVEVALRERVPERMQARFAAESAMMLRGPFSAVEAYRASSRTSPSPHDAAALAHYLLGCGQHRLALRYLGRCYRHWPNAGVLRSRLVSAFVAADRAEEALAFIDGHEGALDQSQLDELRLGVFIATDDLLPALEIIERQVASGRRARGTDQHLRILLTLGRLAEAEAVVAHLREDPNIGRNRVPHFSTGMVGTLRTELRMLEMAQRNGDDPGALAETNFHVAREVIDRWLADTAGGSAPGAGQPVPKRIVQYWDRSPPPPEIARVIESWQAAAGWEHLLFDRASARVWLGETLGADHARAFGLARHVAEESDFFRLCQLLHGGGIYADADDLLIGHPDALVAEGAGLVLYRETFGAVANNILCAPPGHPVIARAKDMAMEALLRRDAESVWMKTGPGMLTRALAAHLVADPEGARAEATIVPQIRAGRHVRMHVPLPHKTTGRYWDGERRSSGGVVPATLLKR